jgi:hypothetical protein
MSTAVIGNVNNTTIKPLPDFTSEPDVPAQSPVIGGATGESSQKSLAPMEYSLTSLSQGEQQNLSNIGAPAPQTNAAPSQQIPASYGTPNPDWQTYRRPGTGTGLQLNNTGQPITVMGVPIPPGYFVPEADANGQISMQSWQTQNRIAESFGLPTYQPSAMQPQDFYGAPGQQPYDPGAQPQNPEFPNLIAPAPTVGGGAQQPITDGDWTWNGSSWDYTGAPDPNWNWNGSQWVPITQNPGTPGTGTPGTGTPGTGAPDPSVPGTPSPPGTAPPVNQVGADGRVQGTWQGAQGSAFQAGAMGPMQVDQAAAAAAAANQRAVQQQELASQQMNDILRQDSPLMSLARQDGIEFANRQGLRNSSLSAGAQQREMARQAMPLAQQNAATFADAAAQNQQLESSRLESNAGREQQANLFNADANNAATMAEFDYEGRRQMTNAGMANDLMNSDRQRELAYSLQQLSGDQDFAKQTIANQTAVDLANIEGGYKAFISENDTAARIFDSGYSAIASILSNPEIEGPEATEKINYIMSFLNRQMDLLLGFSLLDQGGSGQPPPPPAPGLPLPDFGGFAPF